MLDRRARGVVMSVGGNAKQMNLPSRQGKDPEPRDIGKWVAGSGWVCEMLE
jgi:hypothetical protein